MKYSTLLFLALISTTLQAQLTLQACQEKAKANYPLIRQYELIDKSTEFTLSNASKGYLPQFSATAIAGYIIKGLPAMGPSSEGGEDKFQFIGIGQLNQTIWDGGATKSQKNIIKSNAAVDKANVDVALYDLRERVSQLFFGILLLDEQLKHAAILSDNLNRNLKAVKLSNENGIAYSSDVDEVKVELLKAEQRVIETTHTRQGYANMLALLIGESNNNLLVEKPAIQDQPAILPVNRPELNLYQYQRSQVEANQTMNKVGNMPKVGLLAAGVMIQPGANFGAEKMNSLALAGLSVSWNTKSLYQSSNNTQLTKLQLDRIDNQRATFLFNTNLKMTQENTDIQKQRSILAKDTEIVELKTKIKKAYELKYQNGICTMNDLLQVINSENEALSTQATHEVQLLMAQNQHNITSGN